MREQPTSGTALAYAKRIMPSLDADQHYREAAGIIHEVDAARRELKIVCNGVVQVFDVAPECAVLLNGERVKLRLLQPQDCAHVLYTEETSTPVARSIQVESGHSLGHRAKKA